MNRLLAILSLLGLAACASPLPPVGTTSALGLGADYTVKKVEKRYDVECSLFNLLEAGNYCVSKYKPTDREQVHCFKTLGGVDCYSERDPYLLAGRSLPTAPRELADPPMPMRPPENRLDALFGQGGPAGGPGPETNAAAAQPMQPAPSLLPGQAPQQQPIQIQPLPAPQQQQSQQPAQ